MPVSTWYKARIGTRWSLVKSPKIWPKTTLSFFWIFYTYIDRNYENLPNRIKVSSNFAKYWMHSQKRPRFFLISQHLTSLSATESKPSTSQRAHPVGESISVRLVSSLTGLGSAAWQLTNNIIFFRLVDYIPVKLKTSCIVILPLTK